MASLGGIAGFEANALPEQLDAAGVGLDMTTDRGLETLRNAKTAMSDRAFNLARVGGAISGMGAG